MIFSAEVSAVLLFVLIIHTNNGVNADNCKAKVQHELLRHCANGGKGKRDVSYLDPKSEVNGDSERPLHVLQKRQISPISDHDLSVKISTSDLDELPGHTSKAAKNHVRRSISDYTRRCCGPANDCSNPAASGVQCP